MGESALPLILEDLQKETNHWFEALQKITGENPVPKENEGKMELMKENWLQLAKTKGWIKHMKYYAYLEMRVSETCRYENTNGPFDSIEELEEHIIKEMESIFHEFVNWYYMANDYSQYTTAIQKFNEGFKIDKLIFLTEIEYDNSKLTREFSKRTNQSISEKLKIFEKQLEEQKQKEKQERMEWATSVLSGKIRQEAERIMEE